MITRASQSLQQPSGRRSGRLGMTIALATWVAIIASAASGLLGGSGPRSPVSGQQDDTPRSEVRLVSDVASVRPGEPFTAGLHVTLFQELDPE